MDEKIVKDSQGLAKDLVNDCISRQAAIHAICRDGVRLERGGALMITISTAKQWAVDLLGELPPAQPERKRGKWIEDDDGWDEVIWRCSECDAVFTLVDGTPEENEYYFCPHCGADMRGVDDERPD